MKDFDLSLTRHPISGEVSMLSHLRSVMQDMENLILTSPMELKFNDEGMGAGVRSMLFRLSSSVVQVQLREIIERQINTFCYYVNLGAVKIVVDENSVDVKIIFSLKGETEERTLMVPLIQT